MDFLDLHKEHLESLGFWREESRNTILHTLELKYNREILKEYYISDFTENGDKVLIKWTKRIEPLTKKEIKTKYG